jgi:hypothetical protein
VHGMLPTMEEQQIPREEESEGRQVNGKSEMY